MPVGIQADLVFRTPFQASAIGYQVTGNQLVITYPMSFTGSVVVQVTVSDGQATATRTPGWAISAPSTSSPCRSTR